LVGASALALAAAIVLPMVMDREPRPPAQDIQVRIPNQDGTGFTSRIVPGKPAPTPLPPSPVESRPEPAKPEAKPEAPKEAPKAAAAPAAKPEPAKPEPAKAEAKAPEAKPAEKAAPAPDKTAKPAEKAPEKPADKTAPAKPADKADKPAEKKDDARAAAALSGGAGEQWVVQLGAYKESGNVKLLLGKIKQMGLPAYTEPFDSPQGQRTRVRAGPFASKEAAEKAKARIKSIGVDGPVAPK
jgi:DedD protein